MLQNILSIEGVQTLGRKVLTKVNGGSGCSCGGSGTGGNEGGNGEGGQCHEC